jgi:hypothetical protein
VAAIAQGAEFAGDADPYRTAEERDEESTEAPRGL